MVNFGFPLTRFIKRGMLNVWICGLLIVQLSSLLCQRGARLTSVNSWKECPLNGHLRTWPYKPFSIRHSTSGPLLINHQMPLIQRRGGLLYFASTCRCHAVAYALFCRVYISDALQCTRFWPSRLFVVRLITPVAVYTTLFLHGWKSNVSAVHKHQTLVA